MNKKEIEIYLEKINAFKYMEASHYAILANLMTEKTFKAGQQLNDQEGFKFLGFILEGAVTYGVSDEDGKGIDVMDSFLRYPVGVMEAFSSRHLHSQVVRSTKETRLICLDFKDLEALKNKHPKLVMLLYQGIGELMSEVFMRLVFKFTENKN